MAFLAVPAFAQQAARPERPYRGLFASGEIAPTQQLVANASLGGGYDDNILADARHQAANLAGPTSDGRRGGLANAGVGLSYSLNLESLKLEAFARSGVRYYPALESGENYTPSENGHVAAMLRLTGSTTLNTSAYVTRRPENLNGVLSPLRDLPVGPDTDDLDLPSTFEFYRRYGGSAELTQNLSRRMTFHANYGQRRGGPLEGEFAAEQMGAGLNFNVSRGLTLRTGYQLAQGRYLRHGERIKHHTMDVGIDYSRALSFSRRTTLSFSTGSSALEHGSFVRYRATGGAHLTHEIGRTWNASLGFFRGARFVETWNESLFSDVVTASVRGLLNRRLQLGSSAGSSLRQLGVEDSPRGFTSFWGTTSLALALSRHLNLSLEYLYTRHRFDVDVPRPGAWPQRGERQRVTASINVWTPIMTRMRRADVTR
jgi:hypothetical protein